MENLMVQGRRDTNENLKRSFKDKQIQYRRILPCGHDATVPLATQIFRPWDSNEFLPKSRGAC